MLRIADTLPPSDINPNRPTPLLTMQEIATYLNMSKRKLESLRSAREFPPPDLSYGRVKRWRLSTVDAWIAANGEGKPTPIPTRSLRRRRGAA